MTARRFLSALAACALAAPAAQAATFLVFEAGGGPQLGLFEAPEDGGLLTSAIFFTGDGFYDELDAGSTAPFFDPATGFLTGPGGVGFGGVLNSVEFDTTTIGGDPVACGLGECVFSFTSGDAVTPGQWAANYLPEGGGGAVLAFGDYEVVAAPVEPIPLPAAAPLLLGALALLALAARGRPA